MENKRTLPYLHLAASNTYQQQSPRLGSKEKEKVSIWHFYQRVAQFSLILTIPF